MEGLTKFAVKVGGKPIALLTLVLSCLAVAAGLFWQSQQSSNQLQSQQTQSQQQTAALIYSSIASRVQAMADQVASTAQSPALAAALVSQDESLISYQQNILSTLFPNASKVCLIAANVDQPDPNACLPITFATLNGLRQAKKSGSAPMGVLGLGSENAYLLLAHRITDESEKVLGVLLVAVNPDAVNNLLVEDYGSQGYVELQQGTKQIAKVVSKGNAQWKQGAASFSKAIPNSYWRVAYWQAKQETSTSPITLVGALIILLSALWFLRETWQRLLLKQDVKTLRQQVGDFQKGKLKPKYKLANGLLHDVVDDIQTMGREHTKAKSKASSAKGKMFSTESSEESGTDASESGMEVQDLTEVDADIFRAYDIRGIAGESINENTFTLIGKAIGSEALEQKHPRIVVGRDGRLSSDSLAQALIDGILASGCKVIDIGRVPTPLLYFACEELGTKSGVMVTGSHNPAEYNGLKIVLAGKTLSGPDVQALYQRIEQDDFASGQGTSSTANVVDDYIKRIVGDVKTTRSIKVVVDCGNGIAGAVAPKLLREFGCEVIELYCEVDGTFPNHHPNPSQEENLKDLSAAVLQHEAELGLAFDGDGDRLGVVDGNGQAIWPDRVLVMFAQDLLSREPEATIIYDVKSTNLLDEAITRSGGTAIMSPSGYSLIKNKMQETGAKLAGEMSGHIFFSERWFGFDDALYAGCRLLEFLSNDPLERTPSEVFSALPHRESTSEILIEMDEGESKRFMEQLAAEASFSGAEIITIDGVRAEFPNGWGLVRQSNTMPGLTLRFEANSADELEQIKQLFIQQMLQIKPSMTLSF